MSTVIEINGLSKNYQDFKAVNNISLDIKEGEIFGFIGPNGAGKSTTIKMLLNFIFPTSGSAKILGLDCVKDSLEIKKQIGYVSSDVRYYQNMTSLDIFKYAASFHGIKNQQPIIDDYISYFDIDAHKKIADLSLGNKKKVAIVSALLPNPKLLILDEPTNGLDPRIQHRLFDLLEKKSQEGMTIFLSSHDLHEIEEHCHRAAFIKQGKIIDVETINRGKSLEKKVRVSSNELTKVDIVEFGGTQIQQLDDAIEFIYQQDINKLITYLSQKNVTDIEIKALDLEDKFMMMYE